MYKAIPIFIIFLLVFISCNKDDGPSAINEQQNEIEAPSLFEITSEVSFTSATISWDTPAGNQNQNLRYDLFLNDSLWAENFTENSFQFENLTTNTIYEVGVKAKNEDLETLVETSFITLNPDDFNVILDRIIGYNNGWQYNIVYEYNPEVGLITGRYIPEDSGAYSIGMTFDQSSNLIRQIISYSYYDFEEYQLSY